MKEVHNKRGLRDEQRVYDEIYQQENGYDAAVESSLVDRRCREPASSRSVERDLVRGGDLRAPAIRYLRITTPHRIH